MAPSPESFSKVVDGLTPTQTKTLKGEFKKRGIELTAKGRGFKGKLKAAYKNEKSRKRMLYAALVLAVIVIIGGVTLYVTKNPESAAAVAEMVSAAGARANAIVKRSAAAAKRAGAAAKRGAKAADAGLEGFDRVVGRISKTAGSIALLQQVARYVDGDSDKKRGTTAPTTRRKNASRASAFSL